MPSTLGRLPATSRRKGGMAGSQSQSLKAGPSSDRRLQLACVKPESLVTVDQHRDGEYVLGPCTHRPSRHGSRLHPKPVAYPAREGAVQGEVGDWDEVVTR